MKVSKSSCEIITKYLKVRGLPCKGLPLNNKTSSLVSPKRVKVSQFINLVLFVFWFMKFAKTGLKCPLTLLAAYSAVFRKLIWESFYTRAQEKNAHKIERKRKNNIYSAAVHAGWPLCHAAECTVCLELWSTYLQWKSLFISNGLKTLGEKLLFLM